MSDVMDAVIREIAAKHNVLLGRDDPILMLTTIQGVMLQELQDKQSKSLSEFQSEMERLLSSWSMDSRNKAERIINGSLEASKHSMEQNTQELCDALTKVFDKKIQHLEKQLLEINTQRTGGFLILCALGGFSLLIAIAAFLF